MSEESSTPEAASSPEKATASAHRPMRLARREVTDPVELASIIERAYVVRVGFTDAEGMAIVPMNFGFEWSPAVPSPEEGDVETAGVAPAGDTKDAGPSQGSPDGSPNDQAAGLPECAGGKRPMPTFWLHSAASGRKAEAWASSPEVALELDVEGGVIGGDYACAYSYAYESIMAWGHIMPVTDADGKRHGLAQIMDHMAPGAVTEFPDEALGRVAVWRIDVERMTGKRRAAKTQAGAGKPTAPTPDEALPAADAAEAPEKPGKKDADKGKGDKDKGHKPKKDGKKDKEGKPKKDKKKGRAEMGLLKAIEATLTGKGKRGERGDVTDEDLKRKKKADRKALEKATEEILKGQRCDGCGHHCKLIDPRCSKGKKLRAKRLAKAGIRE